MRTEGERFSFNFNQMYIYFFYSYLQNPSYGNAAEVDEDLLKQKNELRVKECLCYVAKEQVGLTGRSSIKKKKLVFSSNYYNIACVYAG